VLQPDVREHDDRRAQHAGRVVAPAEAGLDHCDLDPAPRELVERGRRQHLELRHAVALFEPAVDLRGRGRRALDRGAEGGRLEVGVADPDALGEAREVRREERARARPVRLEQRGGHADGRALAVRADDVDRAEALLRRAERREQPAHALQPEAHAEELEAEQVLLGARGAPSHSPSRSSRSRASLSRSA
jgi:hypothetical protein